MINENKIKLSGTANIPNELDNSSMWDLVIKNAEVRSKNFIPNDDGTEDLIHSIKISELSEVQLIGKGNAVPAKTSGSQARVLRMVIQEWADELDEDREDFYKKKMSELISMIKEREV